MDRCVLSSNNGGLGGAIDDLSYSWTLTTTTVSNSTITNNSGGAGGAGAIYHDGGTLTLRRQVPVSNNFIGQVLSSRFAFSQR